MAREAVARAVREESPVRRTLPAPCFPVWGVFVTLRDAHGDLRGCMGHIDAKDLDLGREVAECARLAALRDPRFPPLSEPEVPNVRIEVSVLEPPEPVSGLFELDPRQFGVIVRAGMRRGLLLPDIEGVNTPDEQVAIAMRKGDIAPVILGHSNVFASGKVTEPEEAA